MCQVNNETSLFLKKILDQGFQTSGPLVARPMWLCGLRHHKKLQTMAEITVLGAVKAPYYPLLTPADTYFYLYAARELIFCQNVAPE